MGIIETMNKARRKSVDQYSKDWKFIKTWECIILASRTLWISSSGISRCCKNRPRFNSAWWYIRKYNTGNLTNKKNCL